MVTRRRIAAFVVIDTLMERLGHRSDVRARVPDSEILTIAVVAARYFGSHHERAALTGTGAAICRGGSASRASIVVCISSPIGWPGYRRCWERCAPRATGSSSIASPRRCAAGCAPGAVGRRQDVNSADTARTNGRSSLDGGCIWSAARMAGPCAFRCCQRRCTT